MIRINEALIAVERNPSLPAAGYSQPFSPGHACNNLYSGSFFHGPINYKADLGVTKTFPEREKMNLMVKVDAFNAFNIQGYINPNATSGEEQDGEMANRNCRGIPW